MNPLSGDWNVECKPSGRDGYFYYHEGSYDVPFYWEYGGGDTVVIARIEEPSTFAARYPWALERKREILERVAQELIRQQAPTCRAEIDDQSICIYVQEQKIG